MKIASLFSGIGGFEKGILQADPGAEIVFASEFDPDSKAKHINNQPARQIYKKNFGEYPRGDITKIKSTDVPDHDILVGGPPCQGFSIAGKREGLCGAKGSMFYEFIRIARDKQPMLLLIENVKGLLSSNGGWDFAKILIELEDAGYWLEWQVCNTAAFLPQNRERVFIIGHLRRGRTRKIFPIGKSSNMVDEKQPTVYTLDANYYKGAARQSRTMILCDSGQGRKDQLRSETIAPLRANTGAGHNNVVVDVQNTAKCLTGGGHSGGNHSDMTIIQTGHRIRRLLPTECEKLQGFPDNWTAEGINNDGNVVKIADTNRYKCLGNAVTVNVIEFIYKHIMEAVE